jgi:hypothetical protein
MKNSATPQEFFVAGGTLWREAPSYILRPADEELYRLALAGEFCNVLAARQMGKSSLMVRTANRLQEQGVQTAILDISTLGGGISTPEAWFFGFLDELAVQLGLGENVDAWWEAREHHNPVQLFRSFIRDVVLAEIQAPLVIFVDEIDSALGMAFTDDFFAAIRAAYNARASDPVFQRITFILLGVARPADLIRDRNRTPYNVGVNISLSDFTLPELEPFQAVFEAVYPGQGQEIAAWVLEWTNGQPYLTQKLSAELIRSADGRCTQELVAKTVTRLFLTEDAHKESNLRAIRDRIESSPHKFRMFQMYREILRGRPVQDEERSPAINELKLTGLVRPSTQGRLAIRNRIYQTVFDREWVERNLPPARTRRIAVLATLLAVVAVIVAGYAIYRQRIQPSLTYAEQFQASNSPDVKLTSLARLLEFDSRSNAQARELYAALSQAEKRDLFTGLSSPQNVAPELVAVIGAVYQDTENTPAGNEILGAMRTVLGQVGAAGAPGLKTEIEFWLKGREEANQKQDPRTAVSFYDSAWAESVARDDPNYAVRFERALALIAVESYGPAYEDLRAVWDARPARQAEIIAAIQDNPGLAAHIYGRGTVAPAILAYVTPVEPTETGGAVPPSAPSATSAQPTANTLEPSPEATLTEEPPSPYSNWIAFALGDGTQREIYIMHPLTGSQRQITNNGTVDETPAFSPDNWRLVYGSNRSQDGWELYGYDLRRGTEQQLTSFDGQARSPVWSPVPGDPRIVFEGRTVEPEDGNNIWIFDSASGALEQVTHGLADSRPAWSPDGRQIVFGRATADTTGDGLVTVNDSMDVYTLNLETGVETNLTDTPEYDDFNFAWSPDGEQIAFTSLRLDVNGDKIINLSDSQDLFTIGVDGSGERRVNMDGKAVFTPSWSPDGRYLLVLAATGDGQNEIWLYDNWNEAFSRVAGPGAYFHPRYGN